MKVTKHQTPEAEFSLSRLVKPSKAQKGFTLIEVAVVMVIVALVIGSILTPLSIQRGEKRRVFTDKTLTEIHDALIGYAMVNGHLPCPASAASNGLENRNGATQDCLTEHGFVPARTLGLNGRFDTQNRILDEWTRPISYSLTNINSWEYAKDITLSATTPDYRVCRAAGCAAANSILAENLVAVVYASAQDLSNSPDQLENSDGDTDFVKNVKIEAIGSEFDDQIIWISPNLLTLQLVKAGKI